MEDHRYNIPMFGVKHWYEHEMEAVGHLASMEDAYLRRMYASKVVSGMNHLTKAIDEKIKDPGYEQKKRDLELMRDGVKRTMEHLKKEYDVTEDNISYKWNTGKKNTSLPSAFMPPSFEPSMSTPPSFDEDTLSLNTEKPSLNNDDMPILTLNNMKNFATAKTGNKKNTLNLGNNLLNTLNKKNSLNLNKNTLNLNTNVLDLNKNTLNVNKNKNNNKNKNKNKNTLIGGRRKVRKGRQTRRN